MRVVDLTSEKRVRLLVDMLQEVSRADDPFDIQRSFNERLGDFKQYDGYLGVSCRDLDDGRYRITRRILPHAGVHEFVNPWTRTTPFEIHSGGVIAELIADGRPKLIKDAHVTGDPVLGDVISTYDTIIAVPLFDAGVAKNWGIALLSREIESGPDDVAEFLLRGNLIGGLTRSLLNEREVRRLNAQMSSQLEEIVRIQRSLLPDRIPRIPGLEIATSYLTSNAVGGDYYDFVELPDDRWAVVIADVSGHGAGAATVVAMLQAALHGRVFQTASPHEVLDQVNRQLLPRLIEGHFITAFMGVFDRREGELTYTNAGHHPPKRRFPNGDLDLLKDAASLPIGVVEDPQYESSTVRLGEQETIVMFTDGITEAFSPPPDSEMFGDGRLESAVITCTGAPSCIIDSIHERLFEHTHARTRDDDQTIVAVRTSQ